MSAASEKYDAIRILGEGSFGKVYLMRDKVRRALVCVKIIKIRNIPKKEREATRMEVDLLRRLNHPNIVRYMDSFLSRNGESLCICMEYCDGGDLASQIKAAKRNLFSESKILHYFVQMALGLHYMHQNRVLHRDLKTQNVFLLGNGRLVLGDLGISKVLDGTMDFAQTCIGTPYYMSPEIFKNKPYSYKSDVWALGCVLYEMTTLNHAFDANSIGNLAQKIIKGRYPPISSKYTRHLNELISQMLHVNPNSRPDLDQILRKPFIKKHIINFFSDVVSRPATSLGEGTMIIRAAVGARGTGPANLQNDVNMLSLRAQLKELHMEKEVMDILEPQPAKKEEETVKPEDVKRRAREQAGALRREEEHKQMIEAALEKLKAEREARSKQRAADRYSGYGGKPAVPRQGVDYSARGNEAASDRDSVRPAYMNARDRQDPSIAVREAREKEKEALVAKTAAAEEDRKRKIREERDRLAEIERVEQRRREDVRIEARIREEKRMLDEQKVRKEAADKQQMDLLRAKSEAAARRDQQRERERARQREEIEQLKRDKTLLDQRSAKQAEARAKATAEQIKPMERTAVPERGADEKDSNLESVFSPQKGSHENRFFQGNDDDISARDKVMLRKQEKQAKEESDRVNALRVAEAENRRIRAQASNLRNRDYVESGAGKVIAQVAPGLGADAKYVPGADQPRPQNRGGEGAGGMELDELTARLHQATKGKPQSRFSDAGARDRDRDPPPYAAANNGSAVSGGGGGGGGRQNPYEEHDSDSDLDEEDIWGAQGGGGGGGDEDEEEDIAAREEELRDQLSMATVRCETLKKNLQETVSFSNLFHQGELSAMGPGGNVKAGASSSAGNARISDKIISASHDVDPEDDDLYDGPDEADEDVEVYNAQSEQRNGGLGLNVGSAQAIQSAASEADSDTTPRKGVKPSLAVKASPYAGLQDAPSPSGKLGERIERLRQRCIEALGRDSFEDAYQYLREHDESGVMDEAFEVEKKTQMRAILGDSKAHYAPLIEQLLFMELSHCG